MAIIKKNDLKKMSNEELEKKMLDLQKQLMKSNAQISAGTTPENPGRVREIKKTIARIIQKQAEVNRKQ